MTTYLYETIPTREGETPKFHELRQETDAAPLTRHPETQEPIRRVILGGWGTLKGATKLASSGGDCCGSSGCC